MNLLDVGRIVLGLVLLVGGGELLVRGASDLAKRAGISSLVVGLTVVALATSAPELAVSVGATLNGQPDLAVGNVVGSNIVNTLVILGLSALVLPLAVRQQLVRLDVPVMVGMTVVLLLVSLDGRISLADGTLLLALMAVHTVVTVWVSRRSPEADDHPGQTMDDSEQPSDEAGTGRRRPGVLLSAAFLAIGVGLLVLGAGQLVDGAVSIAEALGVSELVIGLTVVALGTSLPELATALIAAVRGERDMAVGNIVGSNIANIGLVLGVPALISGNGLPVPPAALALDIPLMLAVAVALSPVVLTGFTMARWEGAMFLLLYGAYTAYLVLDAIGHDSLEGFTLVLVLFLLPLVVITLVATVGYELGVHAGRRQAKRGDEPGG